MTNALGQMISVAAGLEASVATAASTAQAASLGAPSSPDSEGGGSPSKVENPPTKILLIDDEPAIIRAHMRQIGRKLSLSEDRFLTAFDVPEGLRTFDAHRSDIMAVFSDMMMPRGFGLDVYQHVRKTHAHLPFGFWSGYMSENHRSELEAILARDSQTQFFVKPISPFDDLIVWLRGALMATGG